MGVPANGQGAAEEHARLLVNSYRVRTGKELLPMDQKMPWAEQLFHAPIVILSHGTQDDPVLNYGNQAALTLWEMDWDTFTRTPSRYTAEAMERRERDKFLQAVSEHGYVDDYTGIRISSTGRRFYILQAVVWNLHDENGIYQGQAAAFREYRYC